MAAEVAQEPLRLGAARFSTPAAAARLRRRQSAEKRFRAYGMAAIAVGLGFLVLLFVSIIGNGLPAFQETRIRVDALVDPALASPSGERTPDALIQGDYTAILRNALRNNLGVSENDRAARRAVNGLLSNGADLQLRDRVVADPSLLGQTVSLWVLASGDVDALIKGAISRETPEANRRLNNQQVAWVDRLNADGRLEKQFNTTLFTAGASSDPELAGIGVAALGSAYMMIIVLVLALPVGVAAAVYLEEFAPKNKATDLIEVNINNLAAVPSIVFGILGLAVFVNFFGMPLSAPIVGGLVLSLMTLPPIIIATRASLKAVPPSIREAALGLGASKMQMIGQQVLPLAAPGIMTGTIIGMAHALGETAPLLMIGMKAFVVGYPSSPADPATALPVQIYMWAGAAERSFVARTSAAIMIFLAFLIAMNAVAIYLRQKFERKW